MDQILKDILQKYCVPELGSEWKENGTDRVKFTSSGHEVFAKCSERSFDEITGEGESLKAMAKAQPNLIPRIYAAGPSEDGRKAFLITEYKHLNSRLPTSGQELLGQRLAEMHKNGTTEKGYGFDVATFCGLTRQVNAWSNSWKTFFIEQRLGDLVKRLNDKELSGMHERLKSKAYDLLFDPIEENIKPSILHGDLWSGNVGEDKASKDPIIFDPSSFYGHNEFEIGIMHMFGGFTSAFFTEYHKILPKSKPYYEERIKAYTLYHYLNHTLIFGSGYKGGAIKIMKELLQWAETQ